MTATVEYDSPKSLEATRKTNTTDSPIMFNPSASIEKIGCGLEGFSNKATASVMKPHFAVGGKLTTTTTIDLTAAPDPRIPGSTVDCTGKRLLALEVFAAADNAAAINVAQGASNPYLPFGSTRVIDVLPGERVLKDQRLYGTAAPAVRQAAVSASVKNILFTIGASDECLWVAVLGD